MSFNKIPINAPVGASSPLGFVISNRSQVTDNNVTTFAFHNADFYSTSAGTEIDYQFNDPLGNRGRRVHITEIRFRKKHTDQGRVAINGSQFITNWSNTEEPISLGDNLGYVRVFVNRYFASLDNFTLFLETQGTTTAESQLYYVQIFGYFTEPFEFNDSVLSTKAWNSTRYDGRQLSATTINESNEGDTSYGGTPILRNNCRTFYLANEIISLSGSGFTPNSVEDDTLHRIPGFSYLTVNRALTINEDDTIFFTDINTFSDGDIDPNTGLTYSAQGRGFDREFRSNIPIGSRINLRTLDDNVKQRSLRTLDVFFNEGRLRQLFVYGNANHGGSGIEIGTATTGDTSWRLYRATGGTSQETMSGSLFIKDNARTITGKFYTGSIPTGFGQTMDNFSQFLDALDIFKAEQQTVQERRIFVTALKGIISSSEDTGPLYSDIPENFVYNFSKASLIEKYGVNGEESTNLVFTGEVINTNTSESLVSITNDLEQLSTFEISSIESTPAEGTANLKKGYNQINGIYGPKRLQKQTFGKARKYDYDTDTGDLIGEGTPNEIGQAIKSENFYGGSYSVSLLDTSIPSLLVNLNKELEYPGGKGSQPLVILPETLHPFIKDNLVHFMAKAGLDIGDRKVIPALNETNRNLP